MRLTAVLADWTPAIKNLGLKSQNLKKLPMEGRGRTDLISESSTSFQLPVLQISPPPITGSYPVSNACLYEETDSTSKIF